VSGAVLPPTVDEIASTRDAIRAWVEVTPARSWRGPDPEGLWGRDAQIVLKEELFQRTGSFKPRGALAALLAVPAAERRRGVVAVSAGNHAMAVAYAAAVLGTTARVVMPRTADPYRIASARRLGAEVELVPDVHDAFRRAHAICAAENRVLLHPFEGPALARGTGTLGLEICEQVPGLDLVVVPIGGGGLCAGVAAAVKAVQPTCRIVGVEPEGADTMHRSFAAGEPRGIDAVRTIADSLGAPHAEPYSFGVCRRLVDELVHVSDDQLRAAMRLLFVSAKLAVEPAGAAATAALAGPLRERTRGARAVAIVCGGNVAPEAFARHLAGAPPGLFFPGTEAGPGAY
jgi:threonine dehydratase